MRQEKNRYRGEEPVHAQDATFFRRAFALPRELEPESGAVTLPGSAPLLPLGEMEGGVRKPKQPGGIRQVLDQATASRLEEQEVEEKDYQELRKKKEDLEREEQRGSEQAGRDRPTIQPRDATAIRNPFTVRQESELSGKRAQEQTARSAVERAIRTHPAYLRGKQEQLGYLDNGVAGLEKSLEESSQDRTHPERGGKYIVPSTGLTVMLPSEEREAVLTREALKMTKDARDLLAAPGRFDDRPGTMDYLQGLGSRLADRDLWTLGLNEIARNLHVRDIARKLEANAGGKELEELLTRGEQALLKAYLGKIEVEGERRGDLSQAYAAGRTSADVLEGVLEAALTGGAAKALTAGAKKAVAKWVVRNTVARTWGREAGKGAAWAAEQGMRALLTTPVRPQTFLNISRKGLEIDRDENGDLVVDERGIPQFKSPGKAIAEGFTESFIDNFANHTAKNALGVLKLGGRAAVRKLPAGFVEKMESWGREAAQSSPARMYKQLIDFPVARFLGKEVPRELAEQWCDGLYADLLKAATVDGGGLQDFATVEGQLNALGTYVPAALVLGAVDGSFLKQARRKYQERLGGLREKLSRLKGAEARELADCLEDASTADLSKRAAALVTQYAGSDPAKAARLQWELGRFNGERNTYLAARGKYLDQSRKPGKVPIASLDERKPGFSAGEVRTGRNSESGENVPPGRVLQKPWQTDVSAALPVPFNDVEGWRYTIVPPKERMDRNVKGQLRSELNNRSIISGKKKGDLSSQTDDLKQKMISSEGERSAYRSSGEAMRTEEASPLGGRRDADREVVAETPASVAGQAVTSGEAVVSGTTVSGGSKGKHLEKSEPGDLAGPLPMEALPGDFQGQRRRMAAGLPGQGDEKTKGAFQRPGLGDVDWVWRRPSDGSGWGRILEGWPGKTEAEVADLVTDVLHNGQIVRHGKHRVSVVKGGYRATLRREGRMRKGAEGGNRNWELSAFEPTVKPSAKNSVSIVAEVEPKHNQKKP